MSDCCANHDITEQGKEKGTGIETGNVIYACPMHPEVKRERMGLCPECGMNLIPEKSDGKHRGDHGDAQKGLDKHEGHSTAAFLKKFWISAILAVPVVFYSDLAEDVLRVTPPKFPGSDYLPLVLGSVIFWYGGLVFIQSALRELRARMPGMMTLIALAITAAYLWSVYAVLTGAGHTLFWELATLIAIMLLGHWIEMRAVSGAQGALKELSKLLPDTAEVVIGETMKTVPIAELKEGDVFLVRPGGRVPADGVIVSGQSEVNEAMITGESAPVAKKVGDGVIAGTVNGDGSLKAKVTKVGEGTFLSGVMRLVAEAQASKSQLQILSDKAAFALTIVAVVAGGLAFALWLLAGAGVSAAVSRLVAVLVVACPHALGLAVPLVAAISTALAARNGFLVRERLALEAARNIDIVLFDKTGTLTKGEFGIDRIIPASGRSEEEVLQCAASVNSHSEHPLAKAMVAEAKNKNSSLSPAENFQRIPGKGVRAEIGGAEVLVGSISLAEERGASLAGGMKTEADALAEQGKTINAVIKNGVLVGAIALVDVIREESREAVAALHSMGVKTAMITGDTEQVAKWVASELGIDEYFAKVLPEQKSEKVKILQEKKQKVAMVGDGINDAPALTQADVGIAIGAGTNIAIESAGIILVRNDPRDIAKIITLSRLTYRKMIQNLFWAAGYNVFAIPLAGGALASYGISLEPASAAILMSLSTVIVAINAVLMRRAGNRLLRE